MPPWFTKKAHETSFREPNAQTHINKKRQFNPDAQWPLKRAAFTESNNTIRVTLKYLPSTAGSPRRRAFAWNADMHRRRKREREARKRGALRYTVRAVSYMRHSAMNHTRKKRQYASHSVRSYVIQEDPLLVSSTTTAHKNTPRTVSEVDAWRQKNAGRRRNVYLYG